MSLLGLIFFIVSAVAYKLLPKKEDSSVDDDDCVILSVDIGSSSIRCGAFRVNSCGHVSHINSSDARIVRSNVIDGAANADKVLADTTEVVSRCLENLRRMGNSSHIRRVSISCFAMTLVGLNRDNLPCTSVFTYAGGCKDPDPTTNDAKNMLRAARHYERTGTMLHHPCYAAAQVRKYALLDPASARAVSVWQTLSGYIISRWCGVEAKACPISLSDASWTGLLDVHSLEWHADALEYANIDASTCPALDVNGSSLRGLGNDWLVASGWKELQHADFCSGIVDGLAANIASHAKVQSRVSSPGPQAAKVHRYHRYAVTIGTSAAVRIICPFSQTLVRRATTAHPGGLWTYRVSRHDVIVGGALTDGGSLVEWLSTFVGKQQIEQLTRRVEEHYRAGTLFPPSVRGSVPPHSACPLTLPFWGGERAPGWNSAARGTVHGISRDTSPMLLLLSLMEGTMARIAEILRRVKIVSRDVELDCDHSEGEGARSSDLQLVSAVCLEECIIASGAVLEKHWIWRQLLADICEVPVVKLRQGNGEITMRGAAIHAASTLGDRSEEGDRAGERCGLEDEGSRHLVFGLDASEVEVIHRPNMHYSEVWRLRTEMLNKLYNHILPQDQCT